MFKTKLEIHEYNKKLKDEILNKNIKKYKYIIINYDNSKIDNNKILSKELNNQIFDEVNNKSYIWKGKLPYNAIGHEVHYMRNILIYLKNNDYFNKDINFIIVNKKRKFLYDNILDNILNYEDISDDILQNLDITMHFYMFFYLNDDSVYKLRDILYKNYPEKNVIEDMKKISLEPNNYDEEFILFHIRYTEFHKGFKDTFDYVKKNFNYKIIFFSEFEISFKDKDVIFINDYIECLKYMISPKCKLFITPISGLGEMANYFSNNTVLIIHHIPERERYYEFYKKIHSNDPLVKDTYIDNWDFQFVGLIPLNDNKYYIYKYNELDDIYKTLDLVLIN